jgi:glycosyltransferase involved in cell wall biosynthesis
MTEVAAESALYVNPEKHGEIAEAMKTLFKDEDLRSKLIEKGKQQAATFSLDKVTEVISQLIKQAVSE